MGVEREAIRYAMSMGAHLAADAYDFALDGAAIWTASARMRALHQALDRLNGWIVARRPQAPAVILACLGSRDRSTPYPLARRLLDGWMAPDGNRIVRDAGHMALYTDLIRSDEAAARIADMLNR